MPGRTNSPHWYWRTQFPKLSPRIGHVFLQKSPVNQRRCTLQYLRKWVPFLILRRMRSGWLGNASSSKLALSFRSWGRMIRSYMVLLEDPFSFTDCTSLALGSTIWRFFEPLQERRCLCNRLFDASFNSQILQTRLFVLSFRLPIFVW